MDRHRPKKLANISHGGSTTFINRHPNLFHRRYVLGECVEPEYELGCNQQDVHFTQAS